MGTPISEQELMGGSPVSRKVVAQIVRKIYSPPGRGPYLVAELSLLDVNGTELDRWPHIFHNFEGVALRLRRETKTTYEELQKASAVYESGEPARITLNLEDEQIKNLGFHLPRSENSSV
jgi:hypothetical protein